MHKELVRSAFVHHAELYLSFFQTFLLLRIARSRRSSLHRRKRGKIASWAIRGRGSIIVSAAIALLSGTGALAQPEKVSLQFKLGRREVLYETTSATLTMNVTADSTQQAIPVQSQARRAVRAVFHPGEAAIFPLP